jgi:hypothetical protein
MLCRYSARDLGGRVALRACCTRSSGGFLRIGGVGGVGVRQLSRGGGASLHGGRCGLTAASRRRASVSRGRRAGVRRVSLRGGGVVDGDACHSIRCVNGVRGKCGCLVSEGIRRNLKGGCFFFFFFFFCLECLGSREWRVVEMWVAGGRGDRWRAGESMFESWNFFAAERCWWVDRGWGYPEADSSCRVCRLIFSFSSQHKMNT